MGKINKKNNFLERVPVMPGVVWAFSVLMIYYESVVGGWFLVICIFVSAVGLFVSTDGHSILHEVTGVPKSVFERIGRFFLFFGRLINKK